MGGLTQIVLLTVHILRMVFMPPPPQTHTYLRVQFCMGGLTQIVLLTVYILRMVFMPPPPTHTHRCAFL
jgi:hypothetical protein